MQLFKILGYYKLHLREYFYFPIFIMVNILTNTSSTSLWNTSIYKSLILLLICYNVWKIRNIEKYENINNINQIEQCHHLRNLCKHFIAINNRVRRPWIRLVGVFSVEAGQDGVRRLTSLNPIPSILFAYTAGATSLSTRCRRMFTGGRECTLETSRR